MVDWNIVTTTINFKTKYQSNNKKSKFVPDHLKTKMMCRDVVKQLMHAPDQYNTHKTFDKVIPENGGTLWFDWYKDQKLCIRAVDNYAYPLEFVPDCYKI